MYHGIERAFKEADKEGDSFWKRLNPWLRREVRNASIFLSLALFAFSLLFALEQFVPAIVCLVLLFAALGRVIQLTNKYYPIHLSSQYVRKFSEVAKLAGLDSVEKNELLRKEIEKSLKSQETIFWRLVAICGACVSVFLISPISFYLTEYFRNNPEELLAIPFGLVIFLGFFGAIVVYVICAIIKGSLDGFQSKKKKVHSRLVDIILFEDSLNKDEKVLRE